MGTDALDVMLYAINPDGTPSPVASFGSCNVECGVVNEPAELDISSIIGIDLSRSHDFYTVDHVVSMKEVYRQYYDKFIRYPIAVSESCPNKRVSYLAVHARKKRTRKKNFNRAVRICERAGVL